MENFVDQGIDRVGVTDASLALEPTLSGYAQVIWRRKWVVLLITVLGVGLSLAYSLPQRKQYSATADLLVQTQNPAVTQTGAQSPITPTDVLTQLQLVTSAPVKAAVTKKLGEAPNVTASEVGQTNVIAVTATAANPARAAAVANAYATGFVGYERSVTIANISAAESQLQQQINSLDAQIAQLQTKTAQTAVASALAAQETELKGQLAQLQVSGAVTTGGVEVVTPATRPNSPSSPRPTRDALIGLLVGLLLGISVALLVEYLDDRVYLKDEVERLAPGAPVLALVPMITTWKNRGQPLVTVLSDPRSPATESYRSLRTSLQFVAQAGDLRTVLITSASKSEGKTATVANLGVMLANAGERVLLISCDLRRPRLGSFFGADESVGLTSVLIGQCSLTEALQGVEGVAGLSLLGSGPIPPNPAELLATPKFVEMLAELNDMYDVVLIDSPPVLPVTDATLLAQMAGGTVLVVASGQSRGKELRRAVETLGLVRARTIGVVLNEVAKTSGYGYGYGYGRDYGYGPVPATQSPMNVNGNGQARHRQREQTASFAGQRPPSSQSPPTT
jgi:receptor protein-tyrosine kinase